MASLQDQLLKAGLVNKQQAVQVKSAKKKNAKKARKGQGEVDLSKVQVAEQRQAQQERDRLLAEQQKSQRIAKELDASVWQMLNQFRIQQIQGDVAYNFSFENKVKKLNVTSRIQADLASGRLTLCSMKNEFFVLTAKAAEKIASKKPEVIVVNNKLKDDAPEEDDPYAAYQIPDDLMW